MSTSRESLRVALDDGRVIETRLGAVPWLRWLRQATDDQRASWTLEPHGFAIYWPALDDGVEVRHRTHSGYLAPGTSPPHPNSGRSARESTPRRGSRRVSRPGLAARTPRRTSAAQACRQRRGRRASGPESGAAFAGARGRDRPHELRGGGHVPRAVVQLRIRVIRVREAAASLSSGAASGSLHFAARSSCTVSTKGSGSWAVVEPEAVRARRGRAAFAQLRADGRELRGEHAAERVADDIDRPARTSSSTKRR